MDKLIRILRTFGKQAVRSVAFLPVPMILLAVLLGFVSFWLEAHTGISPWVSEVFPALAITSQDTARTILGMFIGGLITLTVFTFSQIMILLNQVASSYSPRLLPKLTGDRALQFVMGLNLATIVLMISVLLSIRSSDDFQIPNFSILTCTVLGIVCLCLFVYFVTAITKKIQVDSIVNASAQDSLDGLDQEVEFGERGYAEKSPPEGMTGWHFIPSPLGGYVGSVDMKSLSQLAREYGTRFYIGTSKGQYVPRGMPILQSEFRLTDEQVREVLVAVAPIPDQFDDWYLPNLKQLTEIALKAMSPGINDPGTALMVIDRQTEILGRMMEVPLHNYYRTDDGGEVWISRHSYADVLSVVMQEMRRYSKEDPVVVRRLFQMLFNLREMAGDRPAYQHDLILEVRALLEDARANIDNSRDRALIARDLFGHRDRMRKVRQLEMLGEAVDPFGI